MDYAKIKLYHLDRGKVLNEGAWIYLDNEHTCVGNSNPTINRMNDYAKSLFPDGITNHGAKYIFDTKCNSLLESVLEVIRHECYPDCLSRFQSFFAVDKTGLAQLVAVKGQ